MLVNRVIFLVPFSILAIFFGCFLTGFPITGPFPSLLIFYDCIFTTAGERFTIIRIGSHYQHCRTFSLECVTIRKTFSLSVISSRKKSLKKAVATLTKISLTRSFPKRAYIKTTFCAMKGRIYLYHVC